MADQVDMTFRLPPGHDPSKPGPGAIKTEADAKAHREARAAARVAKTPRFDEQRKSSTEHGGSFERMGQHRARNYDGLIADALAVKSRIAELESTWPKSPEEQGNIAQELEFVRLEWPEVRHEAMEAAAVLRGRSNTSPETLAKIAADMKSLGAT